MTTEEEAWLVLPSIQKWHVTNIMKEAAVDNEEKTSRYYPKVTSISTEATVTAQNDEAVLIADLDLTWRQVEM